MLEQDPGWKNTIALYKPACSRRALKGKNIIATPCNSLDQYENRSHASLSHYLSVPSTAFRASLGVDSRTAWKICPLFVVLVTHNCETHRWRSAGGSLMNEDLSSPVHYPDIKPNLLLHSLQGMSVSLSLMIYSKLPLPQDHTRISDVSEPGFAAQLFMCGLCCGLSPALSPSSSPKCKGRVNTRARHL